MKKSLNPEDSASAPPRRQLLVVCGVFSREENSGTFQVALFRRADDYGHFEFPGGKVDPGETETAALVRELKEELNLDVEIAGFLGENQHDYPSARIHLKAYWVRTADWSPLQLLDHSDWKWASGDMDAELAAADVPLWRLIFEKGARPPRGSRP